MYESQDRGSTEEVERALERLARAKPEQDYFTTSQVMQELHRDREGYVERTFVIGHLRASHRVDGLKGGRSWVWGWRG